MKQAHRALSYHRFDNVEYKKAIVCIYCCFKCGKSASEWQQLSVFWFKLFPRIA